MVLHPHGRHALARERVGGGEVVGVQVVRHHLGPDGEQPLEVTDALLEGAQRLVVLQVADVVRHPRPRPLRQAEGALELGAAGQQRPRRLNGQADAGRCVPARAAQHQRGRAQRAEGAHHGVVGAHVDRPVVGEQQVGDRRQALQGVGVVVGDRLVGEVAAGHHQSGAHRREQKVVQRGVGQHHAEVRRPGRHGGGHRRVRSPPGDHDRALGARQQPLFPGPQVHQLAGARQVGRHQGERLVLAVLARAQGRGGSLVARAAGQVVAAQPLDRDHRPAAQSPGGMTERILVGHPLPSRVEQHQVGPAGGTGVGLGVEAAVGRVLVLAQAQRRTCRSPPSWSAGGRTARPARS